MNEEEPINCELTGEDGALDQHLELSELREQLEEQRQEASRFKEMLQREQADHINYRRRVDQQREEIHQRANADLLGVLLPIFDDFAMALAHVPESEDYRSWIEGIWIIHRNFNNMLESFGITQILPEGVQFDPTEHEAVLYEDKADYDDNVIVSVLRNGYKLHGRILRPAQVTVSRRTVGSSGESSSTGNENKESERCPKF